MPIKESELILNPDGSVYHLNLKPQHISKDIIFVGDQDRVAKITKYFESIEFETQKREFKTQTGFYRNKRITVISTGIGPDNIDIVMNELDALVNIDLKTRQPKSNLTSLNIVRVGTSGSLQNDIPVDSIVLSTHGLDLNGMLHYYKIKDISNPLIEDAFIEHTHWSVNKARPIVINNSKELEKQFEDRNIQFVSISIDDGRGYKGDVRAAYKGWKKMIKDKNLGGVQLLADNGFNSQFMKDYRVNSIPRFIILDPQGKIVNADAPRPSNPELVELLNSLNISYIYLLF